VEGTYQRLVQYHPLAYYEEYLYVLSFYFSCCLFVLCCDPEIANNGVNADMGGSVPGKAFEQVNYAGGIPAYQKEIRAVLPDFVGFDTVKA
jgi:hypothetical protein